MFRDQSRVQSTINVHIRHTFLTYLKKKTLKNGNTIDNILTGRRPKC